MGKSAKNRLSAGSRILFVIAAACIVVGGLKEARAFIIPFIFSLFLAVILSAPLGYLRRKGIPTWAALLILFIGMAGIGFATGTLVGGAANRFRSNMPEIKEKLIEEKKRIADKAESMFGQDARLWVENFEVDQLVSMFQGVLLNMAKIPVAIFIIVIMVIFMLLEASHFLEKLHAISAESSKAVGNVHEITENVRRYLSIKTFTSGLTGLMIYVFVTILGIDYAVIFGLIAFLLNFVPNVGSVIASVPAILLALVNDGFELAVICAIGYVLVNCIISYVVEPRFMGRGLGLSVLVVFISLIFWAWVLGPVGMFLSAPLTMILKIILQGGEDTRWIAILMGSGSELELSTIPDAADLVSKPAPAASSE